MTVEMASAWLLVGLFVGTVCGVLLGYTAKTGELKAEIKRLNAKLKKA